MKFNIFINVLLHHWGAFRPVQSGIAFTNCPVALPGSFQAVHLHYWVVSDYLVAQPGG